jgi:hypothetical protein
MAFALEAFTTTLDIFVPLTGRMGVDAPVEWIIATITGFCTIALFPIASPLFARASPHGQQAAFAGLVFVLGATFLLFTSPIWKPFDAMHPKRMGAQYLYNQTDGEHSAHLAFMDRRDNLAYATQFHTQYGRGANLTRTEMNEYNSDWDTLYPVSSFLETYRFPLESVTFDWPKVTAESERTENADGTTHIKVRIDHPHLVWPVLAFEAEITEWAFGLPPPVGRKRHHIKSATSVHEHTIDLDLTVRLEPGEKLRIHFNGVDKNQMVPGTASRLGPDMPASRWLMAMDDWARETYDDSLDIVMSGIIAGVLEV